ncbi:MAG: vitamin B12-dependent ribonucleotide reductase [Thermodesulfobacteriota bacterium]|nr:vitamin B12-dependent ribonucleotide reductase [Thermodesulfobacteriota bacterium]
MSMALSENSLKVLKRRYLKKDEEGKVIETPDEMFRRIAKNIASADKLFDPLVNGYKLEEEFYEIMANLEFLPNSPTIMNAGKELQQLSACFVLPVEDSMESMFDALKATALIHKSGGGTGFSFSKIRPKNDMVLSTKGVASGPISFMSIFDVATETIKQGGTRRGANMGILRVDHPDIMEFITAKEDAQRLNNFNLSVGITEEFMKSVEANEMYGLINPRTGDIVDRLPAHMVFKMIATSAWKTGDPGIIFLDRLNKDNSLAHIGEIEATNPCGEQPLLPFESCNLGSINLLKMIKNGSIDYDRLKEIVWRAVHFLDNVIEMNKYPLHEIEKMTKSNRKIGLGVMGFADMLFKLEIPYDSQEAMELGEDLMSFIQRESRLASQELAKVRGPFPNFKGSMYERQGSVPLRNATTTTIAPTGTLSIIANCSSGIEPVFALAYTRTVMDNDELPELNLLFDEVAKREEFYSGDLLRTLSTRSGLRGLSEVPEKWQRVFATAHDISPEWHIKMQSAFQKYTDNAVSKTVNFPHEASIEDVEKVYKLAYKLGCKGVTVYRYGSRESQVLSMKGTAPKEERGKGITVTAIENHIETITPRSRPSVIKGQTRKMPTGCGSLYVTINEDEYGIFEVFAQMGKSGGCAASQTETTGRLVSLALRSGIDIESIIKQLMSVRCPSPIWEKGGMILSCSDAIAKALHQYINDSRAHTQDPVAIFTLKVGTENCPDCGSVLEPESGCMVCRSCGFTKCS